MDFEKSETEIRLKCHAFKRLREVFGLSTGGFNRRVLLF